MHVLIIEMHTWKAWFDDYCSMKCFEITCLLRLVWITTIFPITHVLYRISDRWRYNIWNMFRTPLYSIDDRWLYTMKLLFDIYAQWFCIYLVVFILLRDVGIVSGPSQATVWCWHRGLEGVSFGYLAQRWGAGKGPGVIFPLTVCSETGSRHGAWSDYIGHSLTANIYMSYDLKHCTTC